MILWASNFEMTVMKNVFLEQTVVFGTFTLLTNTSNIFKYLINEIRYNENENGNFILIHQKTLFKLI